MTRSRSLAPAPLAESAAPNAGRDWWSFAGVIALAFGLNAWGLSANGLGNTYYSAARAGDGRRAGTNFFFDVVRPRRLHHRRQAAGGAVDRGVSACALFGYSQLEPAAAQRGGRRGRGRRCCGRPCAAGSAWARPRSPALVLALSPINVGGQPAQPARAVHDPLPASPRRGRCCGRSTPAAGCRWLVLAGVFVGLAFNTKMLAAYIAGAGPRLARRRRHAGWWRQRMAGCSSRPARRWSCLLPWMVIVDLMAGLGAALRRRQHRTTPSGTSCSATTASAGSTATASGGGGGAGPGGGRGVGGVGGPAACSAVAPGWLRLFNDAVGGQIAWLLPAGRASAPPLALWRWRRDRSVARRSCCCAGWLALYAVVFSYAKGTFHSYYTSVMAPAIAALVGIGGVARPALSASDGRAGSAWPASASWCTAVRPVDRWSAVRPTSSAGPGRCSSWLVRRRGRRAGRGRAVRHGRGCSRRLAVALAGLLRDAGGVDLQRDDERHAQRHAAPGRSPGRHGRRHVRVGGVRSGDPDGSWPTWLRSQRGDEHVGPGHRRARCRRPVSKPTRPCR